MQELGNPGVHPPTPMLAWLTYTHGGFQTGVEVAEGQNPFPELPWLQEVATATNFCFYGNPHSLYSADSKNSLLLSAAEGMHGGTGKGRH